MKNDTDLSPYRWLTRIALGLLLALVAARCLMCEVVREVFDTKSVGPGPTTSIVFNWLTILPMLLILTRRVLDADYRLRFRWAHLALGALAIWSAISVTWAGDKWLALIGSTHIVAGASLFWCASQLIRRSEHLRVVVGVCVGLLLANFLHAMLYRLVDLPELQKYFQEHKEEILSSSHMAPGSYAATRFEKKLMAGEMIGFNASPNTMGAVLVMLALVTLSAALQRLEDRDEQGWIGLVFIAAILSLYPLHYTNSKASWAALVLGMLLLGFWRIARQWLARHHTLIFAVALGLAALAGVTVLAVGLSTGGLPDDSLNFRWRYWSAAWASISQHPFLGVGVGNFGSAFLQHRLPVSAEEIKDPHNFLISWASELGVIGLTCGVLWLLGWFWNATRIRTPESNERSLVHVGKVLPIAALAFGFSMFAVDWSRLGEDDRYFAAILDVLRRAMLCGVMAFGIGIVCVRNAEQREVDSRHAQWLIAGTFIAAILFLLQSSIDIAFFQPAPYMLCLLLLGSSMGIALPDSQPRPTSLTVAGLAGTSIVWVVALFAIVVPVTMAEMDASYAQQLSSNQPTRAVELFRSAFERAPVKNADYLNRAYEAIRDQRFASASTLRGLLDEAAKADTTSNTALLARARLLAVSNDADTDQMLGDYDKAISMNPNEIDLRREYAAILERSGKPDRAAEQLAAALEINDAYDPAEPERLELREPGEPDRIRAHIAALRAKK